MALTWSMSIVQILPEEVTLKRNTDFGPLGRGLDCLDRLDANEDEQTEVFQVVLRAYLPEKGDQVT